MILDRLDFVSVFILILIILANGYATIIHVMSFEKLTTFLIFKLILSRNNGFETTKNRFPIRQVVL